MVESSRRSAHAGSSRWGLTLRARLYALFGPLVFWTVHISNGHAAPIYVIENPDGSTRFTNKAPGAGVRARVFTAKRGGFSTYRGIRRPRLFVNEYEDIITTAAARAEVDPTLVRAIIHAESGFNPRAVSPKGALGLMQLMPEVAKSLGVKNPYRPEENVGGGCRYLAQLLTRYRGDLEMALAAYNAGPGAVERHGGVPPYSETQEYVKRVLELHRRYRRTTHE